MITFPEELTQLKNLKIINLSNCKLKELPPFITKLRSLQKLTLNMNYLTTLPNSIKNLTSLEILRVNNNKLTKLPSEALILLPSLEYLELEYNPLPRMFLRPLRGENIRKILMSENLKNEADIEKEMIDSFFHGTRTQEVYRRQKHTIKKIARFYFRLRQNQLCNSNCPLF
jgi:Leucine-rich repeat (LRR) protein